MKPVVFGRYTLIEQLGSGGMAEVFLAKTQSSKGLERLVAIKRIHSHMAKDEKFTTMLVDEANLAAKLTHANIAQIFDLGQVNGQYFIAMEYVHGRDLRALFSRHQSMRQTIPVPQACYIGLEMCEGLDYAHNRKDYSGRELNLVHRDISLNNLILSFDGELKVIDFGVAKAIGRSTRTETGFVKGKIAYMSPEQLNREPLDQRSDVFACGIVLYEMLTGKRLFAVPSLRELVQKVRAADVPRLRDTKSDLPGGLEQIIAKALQRKPEKRYQSAGELHDALRQFIQQNDHYITRNQMSSWMIGLYKEHYEAESARIAALWEESKKIELAQRELEQLERELDSDDGWERVAPDGLVEPTRESPRESQRLPGQDTATGERGPVGTAIGWAPASSSPRPGQPDPSLPAEPTTSVFRPDPLLAPESRDTNDTNDTNEGEYEVEVVEGTRERMDLLDITLQDPPIEGRLPLPSPDKSVDLKPGQKLRTLRSPVLPARAKPLAVAANSSSMHAGKSRKMFLFAVCLTLLVAAAVIAFGL